MRLTIDIETSNAAFEDCDGNEVARILRETADAMESRYLIAQTYPLRDICGNWVGVMRVTED
jgi:hypothetical protein